MGQWRWLSMLALASSTVMCDGSGSYCEAKCDCQGCDPHERDHCELTFEHDADHADLHGCDDYWGDYVDCVTDERACFDRDFEYGCGPEKQRWHACVD